MKGEKDKSSFNKISYCDYKGIFYTSYLQMLVNNQNYIGRNWRQLVFLRAESVKF